MNCSVSDISARLEVWGVMSEDMSLRTKWSWSFGVIG